jgi:hypothetical protein
MEIPGRSRTAQALGVAAAISAECDAEGKSWACLPEAGNRKDRAATRHPGRKQ